MTMQRRIRITLTLKQALTALQAISEGMSMTANGLGEPMPDHYKDKPKHTKHERACNAERRADHKASQKKKRAQWNAEHRVRLAIVKAIRDTVPELQSH